MKQRKREEPYFLLLTVYFCLAASILLAGCGYQFHVEGPGPTIGPAPARTFGSPDKPQPRIRIMTLENKAFQPNIEVNYTSYIRKEFSSGSGAIVTTDGQLADLILKGTIISVSTPALAFNQTATFENRVSATVKVSVEDAKTGKIQWDRLLFASSEYFVTNDLQFNRVLETRALEQVGRLIAQDMATQFLSFLEVGPEAKQGLPSPVPAPIPAPAMPGATQ